MRSPCNHRAAFFFGRLASGEPSRVSVSSFDTGNFAEKSRKIARI
nr:MAG TPA: hypothetical protein [Caudoviricetes sp.]